MSTYTPNWRRAQNRATRQGYWQNMGLPDEERLASWIWEPEGEGVKTTQWAIAQNLARKTRKAKANAEAATAAAAAAAAAAAPAKAPSRFWSWGSKPTAVAPAPLPRNTRVSPLAVGTPLSTNPTPEPTTNLGRALAAAKQKEEEQRIELEKKAELQGVKNRWRQKGTLKSDGEDFDYKPAQRSMFKPSTWFRRNTPKQRTFTNVTPKNQRRLQLGSRTLRTLGKNASALGTAIYDPREQVVFYTNKRYLEGTETIGPNETPTLDLTDYMTVILDTDDKFNEEEKIQRFKHLFLLIEIFEGKRSIEETISGTQKNVFADPKKTVMNFLRGIPGGIKRFFSSGDSSNKKPLVNSVIFICKLTGAALTAAVAVPVLAGALIAQQGKKSVIKSQASDVVRIIKEFLDLGKEKNPEQYDAAKILVEEGPGKLALTRAEKENKGRKEKLDAAITAEVINRYPTVKETDASGKLPAALAYLEGLDRAGRLDTYTYEQIINDALHEAEQANDTDTDPRISTRELAEAAAAATAAAGTRAAEAAAAAATAKQAKEDGIISRIGESMAKQIITGFPEFTTEFGNLAKSIRATGKEADVISDRLRMLTVPLKGLFNKAELDSQDLKKMTVLYCLKDINGIMMSDAEPTEVQIAAQIVTASNKVITAVTAAAAAAGAAAANIINAAKLGAATAVIKDLSDKAVAAAAAGAAAAGAAGATPAKIKEAINDAIYPLEAAARIAAEEEAAEEAAAAAALARVEAAKARKLAAVAAAAAARGGRRRTFKKPRSHRKRR